MDFSEALVEIKEGRMLSRKAWNHKDIFITMQVKCPTCVQCGRYNEDSDICSEPYIEIHSSSAESRIWVPNIADIFANDWIIKDNRV